LIAPVTLLLIIVLVLLLFRGGRPAWPVWKRGNPPVTAPLRILLLVIIALLLIGLLVRLILPLGNY
jgi:hypothetical protein